MLNFVFEHSHQHINNGLTNALIRPYIAAYLLELCRIALVVGEGGVLQVGVFDRPIQVFIVYPGLAEVDEVVKAGEAVKVDSLNGFVRIVNHFTGCKALDP